MLISGPKQFPLGYTAICSHEDAQQNTLMDFGILRLAANESFADDAPLECAYLLIQGSVTFRWEGQEQNATRKNCFDEGPFVLHVPQNVRISIQAQAESEIAVQRTENVAGFPARFFSPQDTPDEHRGAGTMRETSTRIVRTVFDHSNAPQAKLVLGEVIGYPGKWSSYPPHYHPQPEIYFYRFLPENGYGFAELDEAAVKTHHNSTVLITKSETHPQTTAPGYAMWYLWVIRHLPENPYISPTFVPEHEWVTRQDTPIWP